MSRIWAFDEGYAPRMWGGTRLHDRYGKPTPAHRPIGEAWLVADHAEHLSVVREGPDAGRTLRQLLENDPAAVLGSRASLTVHGRFPLLLKLLDTGDRLSIQVHPDDNAAARLHEPDIGKTELWYLLEAEAESTLYCGLPTEMDRAAFEDAIVAGTLGSRLAQFPAAPGTTVFVPAGTVHAIGGGCLLAEIQQNSDLTYRIDDWGRMQEDGTPRALHVEKAADVIHFGSRHAGANRPLTYEIAGGTTTVLAACDYFAGERLDLDADTRIETRGESFHLLLGLAGDLPVSHQGGTATLRPGEALLVGGSVDAFSLAGPGALLHYYVPNLPVDIVAPLEKAGHSSKTILALGGDPSESALATLLP